MISLTFGKHKNEDIRFVPLNYLNWIAESFSPGNVMTIVEEELDRRSGVSVKTEKQVVNKPAKKNRVVQDSIRGSHYQWGDSNGSTHWIPSDVSMADRETELSPF